MCGIAGLIDWRASTSADGLRAVGEAMNETLRHRGPDGGGVWAEAETGVVLAQRRLAIIDVSPGGAQPMHSADARYVITFNGEIYNYRGIRDELAAAGRGMRGEFGHGSFAGGVCVLGRRGSDRARHWHVCVCVLGSYHAHTLARARPTWYQAALLCRDSGTAVVRFATEGVPCRT